MINRLALLLTAAAVASAPALAEEAPTNGPDGVYATVFAGGSFASETVTTAQLDPYAEKVYPLEYEPGFIFGGALGISIVDNVRAEVELSYMAYSDATIGDETLIATTRAFDLLGNIWLDLDTGGSFTPYVGGGVGFGHHEASMPNEGDWLNYAATGLVYQVGAGVRMDVAEGVALDLGYRFRGFDGSSVTLGGEKLPSTHDAWVEGSNHIVQAGLSFGF